MRPTFYILSAVFAMSLGSTLNGSNLFSVTERPSAPSDMAPLTELAPVLPKVADFEEHETFIMSLAPELPKEAGFNDSIE